MSMKRFSAERCAYLGKLKCARYMCHELLGVVNKFVNIIYGVQVLLKTSDMVDLKDFTSLYSCSINTEAFPECRYYILQDGTTASDMSFVRCGKHPRPEDS